MKINDYDKFEIYKKRFWLYVDIRKPNDCWNWTGYIGSGGYGRYRMRSLKKIWSAHRFAYIIIHKSIPPKMLILHKCDNGLCVNPNHLFLGTHKDNMKDMVSKGRQARGDKHGLRLYPELAARGKRNGRYTYPEKTARGERHGLSKLNEEKVRYIKKLGKIYTSKSISEKLMLNHSHICRILSNRIWKHVE